MYFCSGLSGFFAFRFFRARVIRVRVLSNLGHLELQLVQVEFGWGWVGPNSNGFGMLLESDLLFDISIHHSMFDNVLDDNHKTYIAFTPSIQPKS